VDNLKGLTYLGIGCAAGVAATLLLAPKAGPDTVKYLRKKTGEGADYVRHRIEDVREAVTNATKQGKNNLQATAENVDAEARVQA